MPYGMYKIQLQQLQIWGKYRLCLSGHWPDLLGHRIGERKDHEQSHVWENPLWSDDLESPFSMLCSALSSKLTCNFMTV